MVKQNVARGVFKYTESKSGLSFGPVLLFHGGGLATFSQKTQRFWLVFCKMVSFRVKLGIQISQKIRPCY